MRTTTHMAIQAFIVVILAQVLTSVFQLDKSYWAMITALFLVSQSVGESIIKSLERLAITVSFGFIATILYLLLPGDPDIHFIILLISIFMMCYTRELRFRYFMAAMTFFVVFLFASLATWNMATLSARIIETAIGALIALFVSFIWPIKNTQSNQAIASFLKKLLTVFEDSNSALAKRHELSLAYSSIYLESNEFRYDVGLTQKAQKKIQTQLFVLGQLMHYITSIKELEVNAIAKNDNIEKAKAQTLSLFKKTIKKQAPSPLADITPPFSQGKAIKDYHQNAQYYYLLFRIDSCLGELQL